MSGSAGSLPDKHFWLISVPKRDKGEDVFTELNRKTVEMSNLSVDNHKFDIPELRVGAWDVLMTLPDELNKVDMYVEGVVKKIARQTLDLLKEKRSEAKFEINDTSMDAFVINFKWEDARYPRRKSLQELVEMIHSQVIKLDEELKHKATEYNNVVSAIQQRKKRETGSLAARDLTNLVPAEDVKETEYLSTLLVVVSKNDYKDFLAKYENLASFVVPRSAKLLYEDGDAGLYRVIMFKKVVDDFKGKARENKFTVRKYEPSEIMSPEEQKKLENEQQRLKKHLTRWCNTNFAEAFIAWIHLKAVRCFVESVLRYGLPAKFQAMLILPKKRSEQKLRSTLNEMYSYLAGKNYVTTSEEEQSGSSERFYSYVHSDISLDIKYDKD